MLVLPDFMLELKTTFDPSLAVFQRTCQMQFYHMTAAMYVAEQVTGTRPVYMFVVASRFPPYNVEIYVPNKGILDEGHDLFRAGLSKLKAEKKLVVPYSSA